MKDILIDTYGHQWKLANYINEKIKGIDKNTILRFKSSKPLNKKDLKYMTSHYLRQILPTTMSFTFSSQLFKNE